REGELLLETIDGHIDRIQAGDLVELLRPAQHQLKLIILDACLSAATQAAARTQLDLDRGPERTNPATTGAAEQAAATRPTVLPSLAQRLVEELDCAALAMRYPVEDSFATDLMLALYDKLLDKHQLLPAALHLALQETARSNRTMPAHATVTPVLYGSAAAE